jgi:thymidylate kinase
MIIEFAGLPRSGKSSNIAVVKDFYSRSGRTVRLVAEGARSCPFSNKHRLEFASWTANQALSAVIEASVNCRDGSIVLQDRGLFDALAFVTLLELEGRISSETSSRLLGYFGNPLWLNRLDLVFLFRVSPEVALSRDLAAMLKAPPGVITNTETMLKLDSAYDRIVTTYGQYLPRIVEIDSTQTSHYEIAQTVIRTVEELLTARGLTRQ